jgi:hypothetical protein
VNTAIALRPDLHDLIERRRQALELYAQGLAAFRKAKQLHADACPGHASIQSLPDRLGFYLGGDEYADRDSKRFLDEMRTKMDQDIWRAVLIATPLWSLMDQEERALFEHQMKTQPPEFSLESFTATIERLSGESEMIFRRGLVTAFQNLNREYKSHDGFKIGDRLVIEYGVGWCKILSSFETYLPHYAEDKYRDVDRVMHVLDGQKEPGYLQGLRAAFHKALVDWKDTKKTEFETPYWRVRFFKNGNVHLWPTRADLVAKANRMIAEHFGAVLGDKTATKSAPKGSARHAADLGHFPTQSDIVEQLLHQVHFYPGCVVLEPSAGEGNIVRALHTRKGGAPIIDAVEIHKGRAEQLTQLGVCRSIHCGDFLEMPAVPTYDAIVMNPPFHDRASILHVQHAYKWLKPGGRLVSVMPNSAMHDEHFGDWVKLRDNTFVTLPDGSFKGSGTGVSTVMLILDKPL